MSLDKNKSEIVESFKNLLKKADEVQGIELKNQNNIEKSNDAPDIVKECMITEENKLPAAILVIAKPIPRTNNGGITHKLKWAKAKIKNERAIQNTKEISLLSTNERLGIKSSKRIPSNPFEKRKKEHNSDEFEKYEYELNTKINNILNRHLYHWLNRELPKYTKIKLRKYIYELLSLL